jgi:2-keto-3-deoxy-L-rhamnonate aldolase RhmA
VRGYAGAPRASHYGRVKGYAQHSSDEICVLLQVETVLGLQNIEAIANVDGVDGVFIGPGDLSAALGHLGNPKHPDVLKVIDESIARIRACGKAAGILTGDEALAKHYVDKAACLWPWAPTKTCCATAPPHWLAVSKPEQKPHAAQHPPPPAIFPPAAHGCRWLFGRELRPA